MRTLQSGAEAEDILFYPWGDVWEVQGSGGYNFANIPYRDVTTSTDITTARFSSPNFGRWLSADPIGVKAVKLDDPQTWNMYAYVRNNPTTLTDPTGLLVTAPPALTCSDMNTTPCANGLVPSAASSSKVGPGNPPATTQVTLAKNSIAPIVLTINTTPVAQTSGNAGMTIEAFPTNCDNCAWVQTVNSSADPSAKTDYTPGTGSPSDPAPVLGNTSGTGGQQALSDSPSFPVGTNGSKMFVSTIGYMEDGKFHTQGSITWGFTVSGGKVNMATPRESTPSEQRGSLQIIRRDYPQGPVPPQ
jgi:RHS repeat-associated protein